jgi:hypothetical protein
LDEDGNPEFVGDWFDPKHYATSPTRPFTPADIEAAYTGEFMPKTFTDWFPEFESNTECLSLAEKLAWQIKDIQKSSSVIIPMDAAPELGDNIQIEDMRGH